MIAHTTTRPLSTRQLELWLPVTPDVAVWSAVFLLAHVPLGLFAPRYPQLAVLHALVVAGRGVAWACLGARAPERVAYVAAYIVSSEVLWRMAGAPVAWELAKYSMVGVMALWMGQRGTLGGPRTATLYLAFLLPSMILTLQAEDLGLARQQIAFNMSGPLCLMVAVWFFSQIRLSPAQRRNLYVAAIAPAVAIAAVVFRSTVLNPDISFGSESSMQAAGGFGPNQVAAALGLAALLALLAIAEGAGDMAFKPLMSVCVVLLSVLSALTLSRGGVYTAFASAVIGSLFLLCDGRSRIRVLVLLTLLGLAGYYMVYPAADRFTDGALSSRFSDTNLTNRDEIVRADLQIWQEHLWLGVGPGRGNDYRAAYIRHTPAHTEYTRMVAEHGLLGLISLCALAALFINVLRQRRALRETAVVAALLTWSALFMVSYGMRLAAPAFIIGLACMPTSTQRKELAVLATRRLTRTRLGGRRSRRPGRPPQVAL